MKPLSSPKKQSWLSWFYRGILLLGVLILLGRLIELQVIKGSYYKTLADENRIRRVPILAPRGKILAYDGEVLVGNREVERRVVFKPDEGYEKLDNVTDATPDEIIKEPVRYYYLREKLAHLTGYLGRANEDEVGRINPDCSQKGPLSSENFVGRGGLEEQYECFIAGINGEELVEVDTVGNKVRTLGRRDPVAGADLTTNIDIQLQKKVVELMEDKKGSVVITDTKGRILALYSNPSYDPNVFIEGDDSDIEKILSDSDLPLFNRVISGTYPPGSVFKPVVAVAAIAEEAIKPDFIYEDPGVIEVNGFFYTNWYYNMYGATEGEINIERAIARSTDTFFYKTGEFLGIEKLAEWAKRFGYGQITGIDLPAEEPGLIPTPDWKERTKGERWFLGNTYHASIGQGDVLTTPLQVNTVTSAIASKGKLCTPRVINSEASGVEVNNDNCKDLEIDEIAIETTINGMVAVCREGGTGYPFFNFSPISITQERKTACKSGTAETFGEGGPHAWFVVFAPVEDPEIVATVMLEHAGEGSIEAAPIAREIFDYWFGESAQ